VFLKSRLLLFGFVSAIAIVNLRYLGIQTSVPMIDDAVASFIRLLGVAA